MDGCGANGERIELDNEQLWKQFSTEQCEMIVTRKGRRMFPRLEYSFSGLEKHGRYAIALDIRSADPHRYRFALGAWQTCGAGRTIKPNQVAHFSGAIHSGRELEKGLFAFDRVKISNAEHEDPNIVQDKSADSNSKQCIEIRPPHGQITVNTMQKYVPRLTLFKVNDNGYEEVASLVLPNTTFIAVTAYQNQNVINMKIEKNPFARAHRDGAYAKKRGGSPLEGSAPKKQVITSPTASLDSSPSTPSTSFSSLSPTTPSAFPQNQTFQPFAFPQLPDPSMQYMHMYNPYYGYNPYFMTQFPFPVDAYNQTIPDATYPYHQ